MNELLEKLPFELWLIIFDFIDVQELLNFKLICKKFNQLINQLKFKELIIIKRGGYCNNNWYNLKPVNLKNTIICDQVNYLDNQSFVNNLSKIKYLKAEINRDDFEKLNQLTSLEHLELNNYLEFDNDINLTLPNLKILLLWFKVKKQAIVILDAPKLKIINCTRLKGIKFIHPESIKTIEINENGDKNDNDYENDDNDDDDDDENDDENDNKFEYISQFTNLEILKCNDVLNDKIIYQIPKTLKSIHVYSDYIMKAVNQEQGYSVSIDFVNAIVKDRLKLNRNDLKLFFNGVELIGDQEFDDYGFQYLGGLDDIIEYYDQFENKSDWFNYINYSEFVRRFNNQPPSDFFQRFPNIQNSFICRTMEVDQEEVLKFLKNCPISHIQLYYNSTFDQSFYNRLPDTIPILRSYIFVQGEGKIYTTDQLTIEFIIDLFRKMKLLYQFECKNNPLIRKISKNLFCLKKKEFRWMNLKEDELMKNF